MSPSVRGILSSERLSSLVGVNSGVKGATMRIHNLYEDASGESHFRDIEVEWIEETPAGKLSKRLPATGIMVRETIADFEDTWHRAPRRQYVISLAGGVEITASDGETRHILAG